MSTEAELEPRGARESTGGAGGALPEGKGVVLGVSNRTKMVAHTFYFVVIINMFIDVVTDMFIAYNINKRIKERKFLQGGFGYEQFC